MPKDPRVPALIADYPDMPPDLRNMLQAWNDYRGGSADSEKSDSGPNIPGSARRAANRVNKADSSADLVAPPGSTGRGWVFPAAGAGTNQAGNPAGGGVGGSGPTNAQNAANAAKTASARVAAGAGQPKGATPGATPGGGGGVSDRGAAIARAKLADQARIRAAKVPPDPAAGFLPAGESMEAAMKEYGETDPFELPDEDDPSGEADLAVAGHDIGALLADHFKESLGTAASMAVNPIAGATRALGGAAERIGVVTGTTPSRPALAPEARNIGKAALGTVSPTLGAGYEIGELLDEYFGLNTPASGETPAESR